MYNSITLTRLDIKVPAIPSAAHVRPPNRQCYAFLQERIQNTVKRLKKKAMRDLERARPKNVRRKWRRSPKKMNLLISDAPEIKRVSYLCFHSEHTDATLSVTQYVRS